MLDTYRDADTSVIAYTMDIGIGYLLTSIQTFSDRRGRGLASALLKNILEDADAEEVTLYLKIEPSPGGLDSDQLRAWYRRNGFIEMEEDEDGMVRHPSYDHQWEIADLPSEDRGAWREVMSYRTKLPDDAVVLATHGWTPHDVARARHDPSVYYPELDNPDIIHRLDGDEISNSRLVALLLLAEETARYHESRKSLAEELRQSRSDLLIRRGYSKERVQAMLHRRVQVVSLAPREDR